MQVFLIAAVVLLFFLLAAVIAVGLYLCYCVFLLADQAGVSLPVYAHWKAKRAERAEKDEKDAAYTDMLKELCAERNGKTECKELREEDFTFDELDRLDVKEEIEQPETDPDSLMALLEFGLPDEELESVLSALDRE